MEPKIKNQNVGGRPWSEEGSRIAGGDRGQGIQQNNGTRCEDPSATTSKSNIRGAVVDVRANCGKHEFNGGCFHVDCDCDWAEAGRCSPFTTFKNCQDPKVYLNNIRRGQDGGQHRAIHDTRVQKGLSRNKSLEARAGNDVDFSVHGRIHPDRLQQGGASTQTTGRTAMDKVADGTAQRDRSHFVQQDDKALGFAGNCVHRGNGREPQVAEPAFDRQNAERLSGPWCDVDEQREEDCHSVVASLVQDGSRWNGDSGKLKPKSLNLLQSSWAGPSGYRLYEAGWMKLPLHIKHVPRLEWDSVASMMRQTDRYAEWVEYANFFHPFLDHSPYENLHFDGRLLESRLPNRDIEELLRAELIREVGHDELPLGTALAFSVPEHHKGRRRFILWPRAANSIPLPSKISLPNVETIVSRVKRPAATQIDIAAFYQHFKLHPSRQLQFCFSAGGRVFCPLTVATGQSHAVGVAQLTAEGLSSNVERSGVEAEHADGVDVDTYIDNIRVAGDSKCAADAMGKILAKANALGILINSTNNPSDPNTPPIECEYTFLGVEFDHRRRRIRLGEKTKNKILHAAASLKQGLTHEEAEAIFGLCVWASATLRIATYRFYYVYKYMRRRGGGGTKLKVWPSVLPAWQKWAAHLSSNPWRSIKEVDLTDLAVLFSDASNAGWGTTIFTSQGCFAHGEPWCPRELGRGIAEKEAQALLNALGHWQLGDCPVFVFVDNTSVLGALRKGRSRAFFLNRRVGEILARFSNVVALEYVPSRFNLADKPSRLFTNAQLSST